MKTNIISFLATLFAVASCGPSQKITNSWVSSGGGTSVGVSSYTPVIQFGFTGGLVYQFQWDFWSGKFKKNW